jgi:hypothetical protein
VRFVDVLGGLDALVLLICRKHLVPGNGPWVLYVMLIGLGAWDSWRQVKWAVGSNR